MCLNGLNTTFVLCEEWCQNIAKLFPVNNIIISKTRKILNNRNKKKNNTKLNRHQSWNKEQYILGDDQEGKYCIKGHNMDSDVIFIWTNLRVFLL